MTVEIPKLQSIGEVFVLTWPQYKVKVRIDRIIESQTSVSGEMIISLNSHEGDKHLYHARLNLLSAISKKNLANELAQRVDLDWGAILEQATVMTLRQYRKGEAMIQVGNLPRRDKPRFRLKPFVLENELSALYAYGGSGKSVISNLFAVMVQCGKPLMGMEVIKGNSLILDWESSKEAIDEIIKAIKAGMNIDNPEMPYYRRCHRILASEITEIQAQVLEKDINFVVIDSAGMAAGLTGDYHSPAIEMLRALRSLNISILIIDHKPKEGDSIFGSVYKTNECRATWEIKTTQEEGSSILSMGIFHTKHNFTKKFKPWGFEVEFTGTDDYTEEISFSKRDVADIPGLKERLSTNSRILKLLEKQAYRPKEIAEELDIEEGTINTALTRLKKADRVIKLEDGRYGLLYKDSITNNITPSPKGEEGM